MIEVFAEGGSFDKFYGSLSLQFSSNGVFFSTLHPHLRNPVSLQELAAMAVPNPGETARTFLPPCHTVRKQLEEQEYQA